jgi:predicted PurR-regulated permease PerM
MIKNLNRYITIGVIVVLLAVIFAKFSNIVTFVLIAWVLSMIGQPLMKFFLKVRYKNIGVGPSLAAMLTMITFFLIFGLLIWIFVPPIIEQAQKLSTVDYSKIERAIEKPTKQLSDKLHQYGIIPPNRSALDQLINTVKNIVDPSKISNILSTVVSASLDILVVVTSVTFTTFFFLKDQTMFADFLTSTVPAHYVNHVKTAIDDIRTLLIRYFGGILIQVVSITSIVAGLLTALGVPNALLIGLFAALMNIIPYVGPIIGAAFAVMITFSASLDLDFYTQIVPLLMKVLLVFPIMQAIDGFILQPYIFSSRVLAHPLEIFIVIWVGADIWGVTGMILAIPAYTVLRVIARTFFNEFRFVQILTENMDEVLDDDSGNNTVQN